MGTLFIVATPIGNLDDITIRAVKTLSASDVILCEDTRHTGLLLHTLGVQTAAQLVSYYDEIEDKRIPEVVQMLENGKNVALVSDAGTPLVSDPGFRLVRECIRRTIPVVSVPGASAILSALVSSGLSTDKFLFLGYAPEKQSTRISSFHNLLRSDTPSKQKLTVIYYCAPHKLLQTLSDLRSVMGDIDIVIARELTKVHEEVWRGTIVKALRDFEHPKGEFVLLFNILQG